MVDRLPVRVRYAETDQMGRAYHAWYLMWFEAGRNSLMRKAGLPYADFEERGLFLPVRRVEVGYSAPVRYDEEVTVETWVASLTKARVVFANRILTEEGKEAARGRVELALCNREGRIVPWPRDLFSALEGQRCEGP